jgi:hypothetical protein
VTVFEVLVEVNVAAIIVITRAVLPGVIPKAILSPLDVESVSVASENSSPKGIAVDSSGNVYVADDNNHRIQKFDGGADGICILQSGEPKAAAMDSSRTPKALLLILQGMFTLLMITIKIVI